MSDVIIIGGGPAGLQAAIYCARAKQKVLLFEKGWPEYLLKMKCENYMGFPEGVSGKELLERGLEQAKKFGAVLKTEQVLEIKKTSESFEVKTPAQVYAANKILIATGKAVKPVLKNEQEFVGRGVSYCVACDGPLFKNKKVGVVGAGNFAASTALELLNYTKDVTIFTNGKKLESDKRLKEKLGAVKIITDKIQALKGEGALNQIVLERGNENIEGVFMAAGFASSLDFARALGLETEGNFLSVNKKQETSVKGVWAAGDCTGPPFQIAKAVGEAAVASMNILQKPIKNAK